LNKNNFGYLIIGLGATLALYIGFWKMFVGGITDLIDFYKAPTAESLDVAISIVKVVFAGGVGGLIFWVSYLIGMTFILSIPRMKKKK
jgi:hypothetical protein